MVPALSNKNRFQQHYKDSSLLDSESNTQGGY